jgi:DNA replication protein DnaC
MDNVYDLVARAKQAQAALGDRVEREAEAERLKRIYELRRSRTADIQMPEIVRPLVISDTLDEKTFYSLRAVRTWLEHSAPCLLLGGDTGRGKSIAGVDAIADRGGLFFDAPLLLATWRWSHGANSRNASEAKETMRRVLAAPVLVIDDVGTEMAADRALMGTMILKLLSERPDRRRKTLITFNGGKDFFTETYADQRLHSRLAQLSVRVIDKGPDLRIAKNRRSK